MKPFVQETKEDPNELGPTDSQRPLSATFGLLVVSMIGLTLQIVTIFVPHLQYNSIYPAIAWVCIPTTVLALF